MDCGMMIDEGDNGFDSRPVEGHYSRSRSRSRSAVATSRSSGLPPGGPPYRFQDYRDSCRFGSKCRYLGRCPNKHPPDPGYMPAEFLTCPAEPDCEMRKKGQCEYFHIGDPYPASYHRHEREHPRISRDTEHLRTDDYPAPRRPPSPSRYDRDRLAPSPPRPMVVARRSRSGSRDRRPERMEEAVPRRRSRSFDRDRGRDYDHPAGGADSRHLEENLARLRREQEDIQRRQQELERLLRQQKLEAERGPPPLRDDARRQYRPDDYVMRRSRSRSRERGRGGDWREPLPSRGYLDEPPHGYRGGGSAPMRRSRSPPMLDPRDRDRDRQAEWERDRERERERDRDRHYSSREYRRSTSPGRRGDRLPETRESCQYHNQCDAFREGTCPRLHPGDPGYVPPASLSKPCKFGPNCAFKKEGKVRDNLLGVLFMRPFLILFLHHVKMVMSVPIYASCC